MNRLDDRSEAVPVRRRSGFTLIEIVIALGITVTAVLILLALVNAGIITAQDSKSDSVAVFIADAVRAKLLVDPNWPPGSGGKALPASGSFSIDVFFDRDGIETAVKAEQFYRAKMTFLRSPSYPSARLDYVSLEVRKVSDDRLVSTFTLQRARKSPRARA